MVAFHVADHHLVSMVLQVGFKIGGVVPGVGTRGDVDINKGQCRPQPPEFLSCHRYRLLTL